MHEKVNHLFTQNTQRQADIRQNKLPLPVLSLLLRFPCTQEYFTKYQNFSIFVANF